VPRDRAQRLTLRDGAVVGVRALRRDDRERLDEAVKRLSDRTRYLRFAAVKPRLTARELDYLVDLDHHCHEALLAYDPETGRGIAVVRYVHVKGQPGTVEIAATVADDWQGRGLGGAMVALLAERAKAEGHRVMRASVLPENSRSIAMLKRNGFALAAPASGGLLEYERRLD
jgi:RimJ/RimL family protein N-acetyltransferase